MQDIKPQKFHRMRFVLCSFSWLRSVFSNNTIACQWTLACTPKNFNNMDPTVWKNVNPTTKHDTNKKPADFWSHSNQLLMTVARRQPNNEQMCFLVIIFTVLQTTKKRTNFLCILNLMSALAFCRHTLNPQRNLGFFSVVPKDKSSVQVKLWSCYHLNKLWKLQLLN